MTPSPQTHAPRLCHGKMRPQRVLPWRWTCASRRLRQCTLLYTVPGISPEQIHVPEHKAACAQGFSLSVHAPKRQPSAQLGLLCRRVKAEWLQILPFVHQPERLAYRGRPLQLLLGYCCASLALPSKEVTCQMGLSHRLCSPVNLGLPVVKS